MMDLAHFRSVPSPPSIRVLIKYVGASFSESRDSTPGAAHRRSVGEW